MENLFGIKVFTNEYIPGDLVIVSKRGIDVILVGELQARLARYEKALREIRGHGGMHARDVARRALAPDETEGT